MIADYAWTAQDARFLSHAHRFWFNGTCSMDFGIIASGEKTFNAPERDVEKISVPGRNGDLVIDKECLKNIQIQYQVAIFRDFTSSALAAKAWLLSNKGYKRLTDSYNPEYFRMAVFAGPVDFDVKLLNRTGEATLTFDCKPQLYARVGEMPISFDKGTTLYNAYGFPALPIIKVYGTGDGTVTVGGITVKLKGLSGEITLDCEMQNAYREAGGVLENMNTHIYAPEFPALTPGPNKISWSGGVEKLEITPRWWTI